TMPMTHQLDEEGRWTDAAVTIAGDRVILTPRDSDELHCLRLSDGKLLWKRSREQGLYVAAVNKNSVIVVGESEIKAFRLSDGKPAWKQSTPLPRPSGRGFQTDGYYHLPLSTGEIATLHLDSGRVVARSKTRSGEVLGNLVSVKGDIVSQSILKLVGFKPFHELQRKIKANLEKNPNSPEALAIRGEMRMHAGDETGGLADLRRSIAIKPTPRARSLVVASLLEGLRLDFPAYRKSAAEIERLLIDPEQRERYLRDYAAGLHEVGEQWQAFQRNLQLAAPQSARLKNIRINGTLTARSDRWVQGRFLAIYKAAHAADRLKIDREIQNRVQAALKQTGPDALRNLLNHFSTLPVGAAIRRQLVERLDPGKSALEIEFLLKVMRQSNDPATAGFATARLAQMLLKKRRFRDVAGLLPILKQQFATVDCQNGKTGREIANDLQQDAEVAAVLNGSSVWPAKRIVVTRSVPVGGRRSPTRTYSVDFIGSRGPYFRNWSFALDSSRRNLIARDGNGKERWRISTSVQNGRTVSSYTSTYGNTIRVSGHLLVVTLGGRFVVVDTLAAGGKPMVLWGRQLYDTPSGSTRRTGVRPVRGFGFGRGQRMQIVDPYGRRLGNVGPVTTDLVVYQSGRRLYGAHPLSGKILWKRNGYQRGSRLFGDKNAILVAAPQGASQAAILRPLDGRKIGECPLDLSTEPLFIQGRLVLTLKQGANGAALICTDVVKQKTLWRKSVSAEAKWDLLQGDEIAVVEPRTGRFVVFQIKSGKTMVDTQIERETSLNSVVARRTASQYVLLTYTSNRNVKKGVRRQIMRTTTNELTINGYAYGFDRKSGRRIWTTMIDSQGFNPGQPENLPVLIFSARHYYFPQIQPGGGRRRTTYKMTINVLDIRNGNMIFSYQGNHSNALYQQSVDPDKKQIVLQFYQSTVTLTMSNQKADKPINAVVPTSAVRKPAVKKLAAAAAARPVRAAAIRLIRVVRPIPVLPRARRKK
ncbi:MAG: PQQ-binding-like beta-propeller repeat protein, partial [Planctomycetes bacterium]|nr:PQQ-binding-like beta-propeller repeat protein [Planctomycetota bacterium]